MSNDIIRNEAAGLDLAAGMADSVAQVLRNPWENGMADDWLDGFLAESAAATHAFAGDAATARTLQAMADRVVAALRAGNKLLVAGNGGSAGDAQHIAGEFVGRLLFDRAPLPAIALTTDSSVLTAVANDYGYDRVFERQVQALGRPGDVFLGISTSGRSPNVLLAMEAARRGGLATLAFCGADPAGMAMADLVLAAPSRRNVFIQQVHITAAHALCGLVERAMFPDAAG